MTLTLYCCAFQGNVNASDSSQQGMKEYARKMGSQTLRPRVAVNPYSEDATFSALPVRCTITQNLFHMKASSECKHLKEEIINIYFCHIQQTSKPSLIKTTSIKNYRPVFHVYRNVDNNKDC